MSTAKTDALIIGGGIIGLSLAVELQRAGRQVLVIDRGPAGLGCSYGNAGWITPCFAMPLPQPGMFWKSVGWLLDPESPLYIKPRLSASLARWMLSFLGSMTTAKLERSVDVLAEISKESLRVYQELARRAPTFHFEQRGLLMVSATDAGVRAAEDEMRLMETRGIPGRRMSAEEALHLEPSLRPVIRGGVYFPTEAHAEPLLTVQAMLKELENGGGRFQASTEVYDFATEKGRIAEVITTRGRFRPELVVLAGGTWTKPIAAKLGLSIPILGGKGYSLITDAFDVKPLHPMMIVERKIAVTPRSDSVRLAGTLELVDQDDGISPRRVAAILRGSQEFLRMKTDPFVREIWRGLRPCTPDGVPLIGPSGRWGNLHYNCGHQMLGLQSAPGSARLAAELILGKTPYVDPVPFRPARYE